MPDLFAQSYNIEKIEVINITEIPGKWNQANYQLELTNSRKQTQQITIQHSAATDAFMYFAIFQSYFIYEVQQYQPFETLVALIERTQTPPEAMSTRYQQLALASMNLTLETIAGFLSFVQKLLTYNTAGINIPAWLSYSTISQKYMEVVNKKITQCTEIKQDDNGNKVINLPLAIVNLLYRLGSAIDIYQQKTSLINPAPKPLANFDQQQREIITCLISEALNENGVIQPGFTFILVGTIIEYTARVYTDAYKDKTASDVLGEFSTLFASIDNMALKALRQSTQSKSKVPEQQFSQLKHMLVSKVYKSLKMPGKAEQEALDQAFYKTKEKNS